MRILFVCLGNICRSPIAEGVFKNKAKELGLRFEISSAGTANYHIGKPPHPLSQKVCKNHQIDISQQRAQQFSSVMHEKFDYIFALDHSVLSDINHQLKQFSINQNVKLITEIIDNYSIKDVPDPYYGDFSNYEAVFEIINDLCNAFYNQLK